MKLIDISTPKHPNTFTKVDDEDYDWLNQWNWYSKPDRNTAYSHRNHTIHTITGRIRQSIRMHRVILGVGYGVQVDHINGDGLDNRRENLRVCTVAENARNSKPRLGTVSRFKGVALTRGGKKFCAQIHAPITGQKKHLGTFDTEIEAAKAYNAAAIQAYGEFARINQFDEGVQNDG